MVAWAATRSRAIAKVVIARPMLLVCRGRVDDGAVRRPPLRIDDIRAAVRGASYASVTDAIAVVFETDGSLSVVGVDRSSGATDALDDVEGWQASPRDELSERP